MSYLTILLHRDKFWDKVNQELKDEYQSKLASRNFLTVNFTLSEVSDLRVKLFDEIEKALHKDGKQIFIKKDKKIVEQFLNGEFEGLQKEWFYNILKNKCNIDKDEWEKSFNEYNISSLAKMIICYKQATNAFSQKEYREVVYPDIKEGLQQVIGEINKYYDGMIIFIDELSEFLQKKKSQGEESSVLETIQALGERVKKDSIWLFAAVQKSPAVIIDESLYIDDEEEKVFDRFEAVVLSEADIREIIDQRIIQKKENNYESIKLIYRNLKERLPELENNIKPETFVKQYPFHHEFVKSLIYFSDYSSKQRSVIRNCWSIVHDRLNTKADQLITIDILYDLFRDDIIYRYFKDSYDLYENIYREIIEKPGFEFEPELAKKVLKALVIYGIRNKELINARDLGKMVMANMGFGMGLDLIYEEIYLILMNIYQESRGKGFNMEKVEKGEDTESYYWGISPGRSGISIEPEIMAEIKHMNEKDIAVRIPTLINSNQHLFSKFKVSLSSRKIGQTFIWRNTEREGLCILNNIIKDIDLPKIKPVEDDIDFGLVLDYPLFDSKNKKIKKCSNLLNKNCRFIFWIPEKLDNTSIQELKRMTAIKKLLDKYDNPQNDEEGQKKIQLTSEYNSLKGKIETKIEKCYLNGIILNKFKKEDMLQQFSDIKSLVEHFLNYIFDNTYKKHPFYRKKITRFQTNKLIKDFVIPRGNTEYTNEIENVAEPLGIVKNKGNKYSLDLNNELFKELGKVLNDREWHSSSEIYKKIRKEPWGLKEYSFEVVLASLIINGECRAQTKDEVILNSSNFTRNYISGNFSSKITSISKGKLVNSTVWDDIIEIMKLYQLDYDEKKTMRNQDRVWANLIHKCLGLKDEIINARKYLCDLGANLGQFEKFNRKLSILKERIKFYEKAEEIKGLESSSGLPKFRELILDHYTKIEIFKEKYFQIEKLLALAEDRIDNALNKEYKYFKKIVLDNKELNVQIKEVKNNFNKLYEIINKPTEVRTFLNKIKKTKKDYQDRYIKKHRKYHKKYADFLVQVKELEEYNTLKMLEKVDKVVVNPALEDRIATIKDNYIVFCEINLNNNSLENKPFCSCGFNLKDKFVPLGLEKIQEDFSSSIKKYFQKFKSEKYYEQIKTFINKNKDSKLSNINKIETYDIDRIIRIVDEDFIMELNQAFKMSYPVKVPISKIKKIFSESVHSTEIDKLTNSLSNYLKNIVKEEIENKDEIDYERVVLYFKEEN
ncbi:MAG: DUF6079 family protein [Candidatus Woesearchaeota archaeon]